MSPKQTVVDGAKTAGPQVKKDDTEAMVKAAEEVVEATDNTWEKKPNAVVDRLFRVEDPPFNEGIITFQQQEGTINNTRVPELIIKLSPLGDHGNSQQYLLSKGARHYAEQLKVLRSWEKKSGKGKLKEIPMSHYGKPYFPPKQIKIMKLEAELKKARTEA